jgi:thioesterase domain-containing protein
VALFKAEKQPLGIVPDPTLGWGEFIKGDLDIHEIPGHRLGILSEPRVQITAAKLKEALEKADRTASVLPHEWIGEGDYFAQAPKTVLQRG